MGPSSAREEGRAGWAVWAAMDVLRRLLQGIDGGVKVGLFAVEHSRRMSSNGHLVEQERFRLVIYTHPSQVISTSLYNTNFSCEGSQAVGHVPRRAVQSRPLEDFKL